MNQNIENQTSTNEKGGVLMEKNILKLENYGAIYEFDAEAAIQEDFEKAPVGQQYGKVRIGASMNIDSKEGDFQFFIGMSSAEVTIEMEWINVNFHEIVSKYPNVWNDIQANVDIQKMLEASFDLALDSVKAEDTQVYLAELPLASDGQSAEDLTLNALSKLKEKFFDADVPKVWHCLA